MAAGNPIYQKHTNTKITTQNVKMYCCINMYNKMFYKYPHGFLLWWIETEKNQFSKIIKENTNIIFITEPDFSRILLSEKFYDCFLFNNKL